MNEKKRLQNAILATDRAALLFGCYRKGDANDPDIYSAAVAAILADYEPDVIRAVTEPKTGLAVKLKWLPTLAEVKEACDEQHRVQKAEREIAEKGWAFIDGKWQKPGEAA